MTKSIAQIVTTELQNFDFKFKYVETYNMFEIPVLGKNGNWNIAIQVDEDAEFVTVTSTSPVLAIDSKKLMLCELITRINQDHSYGHFSIDLSTGIISLNLSSNLMGNSLPENHIQQLISASINRFDKYFAAIMKVNFSDLPACLAYLES